MNALASAQPKISNLNNLESGMLSETFGRWVGPDLDWFFTGFLGNLSVRLTDLGIDRDEPFLDCEQHKVGITLQIELCHDVMLMKFDCF